MSIPTLHPVYILPKGNVDRCLEKINQAMARLRSVHKIIQNTGDQISADESELLEHEIKWVFARLEEARSLLEEQEAPK